MERTFFASFCRSTNLTVTLRDRAFPSFLRPLVPLIDTQLLVDPGCPEVESAHVMEPPDPVDIEHRTPLSQDVYDALLQRLFAEPRLSDFTYYCSIQSSVTPGIPVLNPDAQQLPSVTHMGRKFCPATRSIGDSNIMFYAQGLGDRFGRALGQIQSIFKHKQSTRSGEFRSDVFLSVKPYESLLAIDAHLDPYDAFEGLSAKLVRSNCDSDTVVIPLSDVVCHVVMCPFRSPASARQPAYACSVAVALDEVGSTIAVITVVITDLNVHIVLDRVIPPTR